MSERVAQHSFDQSERRTVPKYESDGLYYPRDCRNTGEGSRSIMPTSRHNSNVPMHHLSVSSKSNSEDFVHDPDAPNFARNESAFRGPLQYDSTSPRSPRGKPRNSWLRNSGSASEGPLRRWADEPLGIVLGEDVSPDDKTRVSRRSNKTPGSDEERPREELVARSAPHPSIPTLASIPKMQENVRPNHDTDPNDGELSTGNNRFPRLASRRWAIIRNRLALTRAGSQSVGAASAVAPTVNISDELFGGGLAALMLKMHFDRDEQNRRRVPVLLHHLKIRVSDSVHPLKGARAAFRIEVM